MIDETKLIEDLKKYAHISSGDSVDTIKVSIRIVEDQPKVGEWIRADNPPKDENFVLLSFENFSIPMIGRYEDSEDGGAYYLGDCDEYDTCLANDLYVNAWMPLPFPFRDKE